MTEKEFNKFVKRMEALFFHFTHSMREIYFHFAHTGLKDKLEKLRQYAIEYIVDVIPDEFQLMFFNSLAEITGTGV